MGVMASTPWSEETKDEVPSTPELKGKVDRVHSTPIPDLTVLGNFSGDEFEFLPGTFGYNIEMCVKLDDRAKFAEQMKKLPSMVNKKWEVDVPKVDPLFWPTKVMEWVCNYSAVKCATAWLEGECGSVAYIKLPLLSGSYPLHVAADHLSLDMVELFIKHGARPNDRSESESWDCNLLPLDVSLLKLSYYHPYMVDWTPDQSLSKLIVLLCLRRMKRPLDVTRLLAQHTDEIDSVFQRCVMDGKLIQMAALLMVARERVTAAMLIATCDWIKQEITIVEEKIKSRCDIESSEYAEMFKHKVRMTSALALLGVFEGAGVDIETYVPGVNDQTSNDIVVADLQPILARVGLDVKDNIINLRTEERIDLGSWLHSKNREVIAWQSIQKKAPPPAQTPYLRTSKRPPYRQWYGVDELKSYIKWHHTLRLVEEDEVAFMVPGRMQLQARRTTGQSLQNFLSCTRIASFALVIKRGMTRM